MQDGTNDKHLPLPALGKKKEVSYLFPNLWGSGPHNLRKNAAVATAVLQKKQSEKSHMFVDQELLPKHNIELFRGLNRSERQERFGNKNKDVFNVFCEARKTVFKFEPCVSSKHAKET